MSLRATSPDEQAAPVTESIQGSRGAPSVLVAGSCPNLTGGGGTSTSVLVEVLSRTHQVTRLCHRVGLLPRLVRQTVGGQQVLEVGVQPLIVHLEGTMSGTVNRHRLRQHTGAWAVFSRHASSLLAAGIPYVIWEATTFADELRSIPISEVRRNGKGSGAGAALHRVLLPAAVAAEGLLYRRARQLLAMSEYTRDRMILQHDLDPDRVAILSPPPSLAFLRDLATAREAITPASDRLNTKRLLFVGRVSDPRKNATLMFEAVRLVRARNPAVSLTVVGPYTPEWLSRIAAGLEKEDVVVRGEVSGVDLAATYLSHDLLLVSSHQEGFGFSVAEALHAGLPVVSTRCGGPEGMIRASQGGLLTDHDPASFAAGIESLLDDGRRAECRASALRYAATSLTFDAFATRVAGVTSSLFNQPQS